MAVFGCDALMHVPKGQRSTWQPKMEPGIYLGHDWVQNCSLIFLLRTRRVIPSRDVVTSEGSFKHAAALRAGPEEMRRMIQEAAEGSALPEEQQRSETDSEEESDDEDAQSEPMEQSQDGEEEEVSEAQQRYEVERLTGKRWINGRVHYRVKWAGYPSEDATWEPATELRRSAARMVREFERHHTAASPDHR